MRSLGTEDRTQRSRRGQSGARSPRARGPVGAKEEASADSRRQAAASGGAHRESAPGPLGAQPPAAFPRPPPPAAWLEPCRPSAGCPWSRLSQTRGSKSKG